MIESKITQLVAAIPSTDRGKIPGQPEDPETTNLLDINNARFYIEPSSGGWADYSLPIKIGDPVRPIISMAIGPHVFQEAICNFRASVNIMPKVMEILCCT